LREPEEAEYVNIQDEEDELTYDAETVSASGGRTRYAAAHPYRLPVLLGVLILILISAILVFALPQFYIREIHISGCSVISEEEILRDIQISEGMHLFRNIGGGIVELFTFRYGNIENGLREKYPYIKDVNIQIHFPSEVNIDIEERQRIGYVELPDGYAVIDLDSYVVELERGAIPEGVPQMKGLPVRSAVLGEKIELASPKEMNTCITVLGAVLAADDNKETGSVFSLMQNIRSIRSVGTDTVFLTVFLPSNGRELTVQLGSLKDVAADMTWLRYAVDQGAFDNAGDGYLDMSGEDNTFSPIE
jgi:POTRA domain, FtsQ-type